VKTNKQLIQRFLEMLADLYLADNPTRSRELINRYSEELRREQSSN
jgi:hypothetical protein